MDQSTLYFEKEGHKHLLQCDLCNKSVEIQCPMEEIEEVDQSTGRF